MRHIHPVGMQEKFVASGVYTHYRDGKLVGLVEKWSIHELPDHSYLVRVDWDGRNDEFHRDSMLFEALYEPGSMGEKLNRLEVHAYGAGAAAYKTLVVNVNVIKASYTFFDDHILVSRELDGKSPIIEEYDWSESLVVRPAGSRLLMGFAIARYAAQPNTKIETFFFEPHYKDETAFQGYFCDEIVRFVAEEEFVVAGKTVTAKKVEWLTPDEDLKPEAIVWLDKCNVLLRHKTLWFDGDAVLTQYAHRPESLTS
jgi:hypothetical protein